MVKKVQVSAVFTQVQTCLAKLLLQLSSTVSQSWPKRAIGMHLDRGAPLRNPDSAGDLLPITILYPEDELVLGGLGGRGLPILRWRLGNTLQHGLACRSASTGLNGAAGCINSNGTSTIGRPH